VFPRTRVEANRRVAEALVRISNAPIARVAETLGTLCTYAQGIGSASIFTDSGERRAAELVCARVQGPLVAVDVGANVGSWTSALLAVCGDRASIHCLEPAQDSFTQLEQRYRDLPRVHTWNLGLSDRGGQAQLFSDEPLSGLASVYNGSLESRGRNAVTSTTVTLTTLDEFCKREEIERIDFLKIDVEGAELAVLRGAGRLLDERRIQFIQFEFGHPAIHAGTHMRNFYDALPDFDIYRVVPRGLIALGPYRTSLENFVSATNYLAVGRLS
jgi:FkbM family methyltransferase